MRKLQKGVLVLLGLVVVTVAAVCGYAIKVAGDANSTVNQITEKIAGKTKTVDTANLEPFSILLLGIDSGGLGRTDQGRSDTTMVVTVNPKKGQTIITSLDRDMLIKIVGKDTHDKLNAAYSYGGVEMTMDTLENFLNIPINHYLSINLDGLEDLIDAVGGIDVNNKIDFTLDGVHVPAGKIHLDGEKGLAYSRMRHEDPQGDVGRQARQREVLTKVVKKIMSAGTITGYQKILKAVGSNTKTDLSWDEMIDMATSYQNALSSIKEIQISGQGKMIDETYYQIPAYHNLLDTQNTLREQLNLDKTATLSILDDENQMLYDDSEEAADAGWDEEEALNRIYYTPYFADTFGVADSDDSQTEDSADAEDTYVYDSTEQSTAYDY